MAVALDEEEKSARIVVPDHQLSLAIGKEGQNARLSAKLTGWRIDIKSETQAKGTDFLEIKKNSTAETQKEEVHDFADNLAETATEETEA